MNVDDSSPKKYLSQEDWANLEIIWDYLKVRYDLPDKADAMVIGGAALMTDMAQYGAELYHRGLADRIVATGFTAKNAVMTESEAALIARVLKANGVPKSAIVLDEQASNNGENITHSARLLPDLDENSKVILVHKPFMTRRFLATAQAAWPQPQPQFFATSIDMPLREYFVVHHQAYPDDPLRMVRSMLGDYERIRDYPKLGYSTKQEFSEVSEAAYQALIERGFSARGIGS